MPPPMIPAPRTAADSTFRAAFAAFLAVFLTQLVAEEDADERGGDRSAGDPDEGLGLDRERLVAPLPRPLLDRLDGGDRGGVVRAGLAADESLRRLEDHRRFDLVQLERARLRGTALLPVERARRRVPEDAERRVPEALLRNDAVHGADLQGVRRGPLLAGGDPLDGVVGPDEPREPDRPAPARKDPELRLGEADLRVVGHHAEAGREADLEAAAEGEAVDHGDRRAVEVLEVGEGPVDPGHPGGHLLGRPLEERQELGDVGSDDEDVLAARQEDALEAPSRP